MEINEIRQALLREWATQTAWVGEAKTAGGYLTGYRVGRAKACERLAQAILTERLSRSDLGDMLLDLAVECPRRDDDELDEYLVGWDAGHYDLRAELLAELGGVAA
jgi:hypothetical protein